MYLELVAAYTIVFVLFVGYLVYLQRKLASLEEQLRDLGK
jgi:CcmD family protein